MYVREDVMCRLAQKWQLSGVKHLCSFCNVHIYTGFLPIKDGSPLAIVVKINFDHELFVQEACALTFFQNHGAVRLLDTDDQTGALLLERIIPGSSLKSCFPHDDLESVHILVTLIKKLHSFSPCVPSAANSSSEVFPTVADWLKSLQGNYPFVSPHLTKAQALANSLLKTHKNILFLHGDLHHDNVLLGPDDMWIAIDPKGVYGDPAYEVGAFMRNPLPELLAQPDVKAILRARLELFSQLLAIDQQRLREWSYVQAVLAACWAIEDGVEYASFIAVAELLDEL